ncbi:MAG: hypothetical protein CM1200mP18_20100 [Gammaproteobacteria bacterium]|nr:MAG: hypothetical protein CM1200mP18_20100 [Gammaproteobacteria bacterium]
MRAFLFLTDHRQKTEYVFDLLCASLKHLLCESADHPQVEDYRFRRTAATWWQLSFECLPQADCRRLGTRNPGWIIRTPRFRFYRRVSGGLLPGTHHARQFPQQRAYHRSVARYHDTRLEPALRALFGFIGESGANRADAALSVLTDCLHGWPTWWIQHPICGQSSCVLPTAPIRQHFLGSRTCPQHWEKQSNFQLNFRHGGLLCMKTKRFNRWLMTTGLR